LYLVFFFFFFLLLDVFDVILLVCSRRSLSLSLSLSLSFSLFFCA